MEWDMAERDREARSAARCLGRVLWAVVALGLGLMVWCCAGCSTYRREAPDAEALGRMAVAGLDTNDQAVLLLYSPVTVLGTGKGAHETEVALRDGRAFRERHEWDMSDVTEILGQGWRDAIDAGKQAWEGMK